MQNVAHLSLMEKKTRKCQKVSKIRTSRNFYFVNHNMIAGALTLFSWNSFSILQNMGIFKKKLFS